MTDQQEPEVRQDLLPAISPKLQQAGITIREDDGYRTLGIPPTLRETFNIIFPTVELTQQHPDFWPTVREIRLSPTVDAYDGASHHKANECSPNKLGLYKLAEAAKINVTTHRIPASHLGATERCGWTAVAKQRHSDGTETILESSSTFDNEAERLQIESGPNKASVESRWRTKILKASELTETIAIERAIRGMLKLPHKMTKADFAKPWLVVCYAFIPTSEEGRAAAAIGMSRLYGGDDTAAAPTAIGPAAHETRALPEGARALEAADDEPPIPPAPPADMDESGEVLEGVIENDPELDALAERGLKTKPPIGSYQEFELEAILAMRPRADAWLRHALAKDWSGADEEFGRLITAVVTKHAPDLLVQQENAA